jgi:hypothetical protein
MRSKRFRIVHDNLVAKDFSELRSKLHTDEGRAAEL